MIENLMNMLDEGVVFDSLEKTKAKNVFKTGNSLFPAVYWDRFYYTELNIFCLNDLDLKPADFGLKVQGGSLEPFGDKIKKGDYTKFLKRQSERINNAVLDDRWEYVFEMIDKRIAIGMYILAFNDMPEDQRWDAFVAMYQRVELGFEMLEDHYHNIFQFAPMSKKRNKRIRKLAKVAGNEFTIYHGAKLEASRWDPKDYYSWTLSEDTARFFANRFNKDGEIWKRDIKFTDAIDFLVDRNEQEVLVDYQSLPAEGETRYDSC